MDVIDTAPAAMLGRLPFISVVIGVRNEAAHIERCVRTILENDYPHDSFEVLVIDGMSTDATRAIVSRIAAEDARVRLLENPLQIVSAGVNIGIREARGQVITWLGGHAEFARDFLCRSAEALLAHPEAWCVGGPTESVAVGTVGRSIAAAMSTSVGVGNARFRLGSYEGYVDTVTFASYRRSVFDTVGMFDEQMIRNQDVDLNDRLLAAGGKIWMSPAIKSRYYPRSGLRKLARQYYQYGYWRIRNIQKSGKPTTLRQIVPLFFVVGWLVLGAGAIVWWPFRLALAAALAAYLMLLAAGSLLVARRAGLAEALLAPLVFITLHFSYGLGSLEGVIRFLVLRKGLPARPEDYRLTR